MSVPLISADSVQDVKDVSSHKERWVQSARVSALNTKIPGSTLIYLPNLTALWRSGHNPQVWPFTAKQFFFQNFRMRNHCCKFVPSVQSEIISTASHRELSLRPPARARDRWNGKSVFRSCNTPQPIPFQPCGPSLPALQALTALNPQILQTAIQSVCKLSDVNPWTCLAQSFL